MSENIRTPFGDCDEQNFDIRHVEYASRLKEINVPPEQAEMQAEAMKEVLESRFQTAELATKTDIALVKKDIEATEHRLDAKIDALEQKLDAKIEALGNKLTIRITLIVIAVVGAIQALAVLLQR